MTNFQKLVQGLQEANAPCNVKLFNTGDISVECGWNYPDEIFEQVDSIAKAVGVRVDICADVHGGEVEIQQRVFGGPKIYRY